MPVSSTRQLADEALILCYLQLGAFRYISQTLGTGFNAVYTELVNKRQENEQMLPSPGD